MTFRDPFSWVMAGCGIVSFVGIVGCIVQARKEIRAAKETLNIAIAEHQLEEERRKKLHDQKNWADPLDEVWPELECEASFDEDRNFVPREWTRGTPS